MRPNLMQGPLWLKGAVSYSFKENLEWFTETRIWHNDKNSILNEDMPVAMDNFLEQLLQPLTDIG